jgi:uncharacterized protein (TIGR03790 family)
MFYPGSVLLGQSSLAPRVLVAYERTDANSLAVANHYLSVRGIPSSNLCPLSLPNPSAFQITLDQYNTSVKTPIKNCLQTLGPRNILYIVLAFIRPLEVTRDADTIFALDSLLADAWDQHTTRLLSPPNTTHSYYGDSQSQGNTFAPFQSLADFRTSSRTPTIYSVWRLDGATAAATIAKVDSVASVEAQNGSTINPATAGNACIDLTGPPDNTLDADYSSFNWDLYRAAQALQAVGNPVVLDNLGTSFGVPPSGNCANASLYVGWYNYGVYHDAFAWNPGAIGWDLDSGALYDPRGGVWWGTGALNAGLAVTSGAITEPLLPGIPRASVIRNLLEGANVGDAFLRNTRWLKWRIVNVGDPLYRPFPGAVAPYNAPVRTNSLSLLVGQQYVRQFLGGTSIPLRISLTAPAPIGGLSFSLSSTDPVVALPVAVAIPAGQSSAIFSAALSTVTAATDVQVTASSGSFSVSNTVTVNSLLKGLFFPLNPVVGGVAPVAQSGTAVKAAMILNGAAPMGGVTVSLSSDQTNLAVVPNTIVIPAGQSEAVFNITTSAVTAGSPVTFTSSLLGVTHKVSLILTP